jgi:hypothetical protein
VHTDASEFGLGGVLSQIQAGEEHPITYISRKLLPNERKYSTVEKEALAIKGSLDKFRYYLLGREFTLVTDHAPLKWMAAPAIHFRGAWSVCVCLCVSVHVWCVRACVCVSVSVHQCPSDAVVPGSPGLQVYGGPPTGPGARQRRRPIETGHLLGRVPGLPEA